MPEEYHPSLWEKIVAVVLAFLVFGLVAYLVIKNEPLQPETAVMLRIFISLAVSILGATIPGFLKVDLSTKGLTIRAAGALALFVITFFFSPKVAPDLQENKIPPLVDPKPVTRVDSLFKIRSVFAAESQEKVPALALRVALEGKPPNNQQKLYDLTISNANHGQIILTTFHVRWAYSPGVLYSVEEGISLRPSERYSVTIPLDVDKSNQIAEMDVPLSPAVLMPPANESGPSIKTIRLEVNYKFAGRLKYHPAEGWELYYDVAVRADSGDSLTLLRRAWRADKNEDWVSKFQSANTKAAVQVDSSKRSICVPPGYHVQLTSTAEQGYGIAFDGQLETGVHNLDGVQRPGPTNPIVLGVIDPSHGVSFSTPPDAQEGCYAFKIGAFRVEKLPITDIRGDDWDRGDFAQVNPSDGRSYVIIMGLPHNGQVKMTWVKSPK
jgi:hypothetical protein